MITVNDKKSPYDCWYQTNKEYYQELITLAQKHPQAQAILHYFVTKMDRMNTVMCSHAVLSQTLGVSISTITRAIKVLKDSGFICVGKIGSSNIYTLNKRLFWNSWKKYYPEVKFEADIIIAGADKT